MLKAMFEITFNTAQKTHPPFFDLFAPLNHASITHVFQTVAAHQSYCCTSDMLHVQLLDSSEHERSFQISGCTEAD